ncbi:MAG: TolC family protein [Candidatus Zixiibacteriota bacterium]|nr:MAG: TolC family protein [candidate division Zixibacteria bacterium]
MKRNSVSAAGKRWSTFSCTVLKYGSPVLRCLGLALAGLSLAFVAAATEIRLDLAGAIDRSLKHSYQIKVIQHDSATASYELRAAKARRLPTLTLDAVSFRIDELQSADIPIPSAPALEIGAKDNYQADFRLSVPLFTGGKITSGINFLKAKADADIHSLRAERTTNAYRCRTAYLNLMIADRLVSSAAASLGRIEIVKDDVQKLYRSGLADSVDLLDAELSYQEALRQIDLQRTRRANASSVLAQLIGASQDELIVPSENIIRPKAVMYESPKATDIRREELKFFESRIQAADNATRLQLAEYFPSLSAYAGYSFGKPNRDVFDAAWNDYFSVGLALNWAFNLGGSTGNSIDAARQRAFSQRMAKKESEDRLLLRARTALQNLHHAYRAMEITGREYEISRRKFRLAGEKRQAGQLTVNRLLELEQELTSAEQLYQVSMITYYLSEADYLYAIGSPEIFGGL